MTNVIKAFKLVSGEEVIAEVISTEAKALLIERAADERRPTEFRLRRPHVMQIQQVAPGKFGVALIPWFLSNQDLEEVIVPAGNVLTTPIEPHATVQKQYLEQTSGLAIATGGLAA